MKIPFDIKYRPQIESGEYKVETRDGRSVRIICWDRVAKENTDDDLNICVLVPEDNGEGVYYYHQSGKKWVSDERFDLFLITPEPELNEFEQEVRGCVIKNLTTHIKDGNEIARFRGQNEAGRITGISGANISQVCNHKRKTAGGFIWRYEV